ncbi:MAG: polysaccharide deacetylase family protein [Armatimonadota bacterium]|nr:MAG: polysaccharide deacetylase family protein [Armatimonadota bacterium]
MVARRMLLVVLVVLLAGASFSPSEAKPPASNGTALILYDSSGEYGWIGEIHARMLGNLLGHFPVGHKVRPIEKYRSGELDGYSATFYIGSVYDNPLPFAFARDVALSTKPICWFKYNIWQLAWGDPRFGARFGFTFNWLDYSGYDVIHYAGETFSKDQNDPELGVVWVLYPDICTEIATAARSTETEEEESIPYIVKGDNLWYFADLPFSYIGEEDRYLILCDVLHDILGIDHPETKNAIVRIEDVDTNTDPDALRQIADYLYSRGVPFAVSVIPAYRDPFGYYNLGVPEFNRLSWEPELVAALQYMVSKGGQIVLHGCTHQYDAIANPYNGVTGDDFEFYRVELDDDGFTTIYTGPVPKDSKNWVLRRIKAARAELKACGLKEVAWETPHYAASPLDYVIFGVKFPVTIQRVLYFDLPIPASAIKGTGFPYYFAGQFFPYPIYRDMYGQRVLPENLGNYEPDPLPGDRMWLVEDILRCAEKNAALRDTWASFYFHPFYDITKLQETVEGIQAMGFTFVPIPTQMP